MKGENISLLEISNEKSFSNFEKSSEELCKISKKKKKIRFNIHNYKIKGQNFTIKFGHCLLLGTINLHNDIYCLA